jgi:hypothetical protein
MFAQSINAKYLAVSYLLWVLEKIYKLHNFYFRLLTASNVFEGHFDICRVYDLGSGLKKKEKKFLSKAALFRFLFNKIYQKCWEAGIKALSRCSEIIILIPVKIK